MSASEKRNIIIKNDQILIENFSIRDHEIISYFKSLEESQNINRRLEEIIKIGVVAMKSMGTAGDMNYVDNAFNSLENKFKQHIDSAFGDKGQFSEIIKGHFGEDGKLIKEIFSPNKDGSPLHILQKILREDLEHIKREIVINKGIEEGIEKQTQKSTQKGFKFEDECEERLSDIAKNHSDILEKTGSTIGEISKKKKGDFVIKLGDNGKKIVFEVKDTKIALPEVKKELKEAMENREAEYGIFIAKNVKQLPDFVGWFNEYEGNKLVCAIGNDDGDSLIGGELIHIAYKWARARLQLESNKEKKLEYSIIVQKTAEIQNKVKEMVKIRTQCKNIEESTDKIKNSSREIENEIKRIIEEMVNY